MPPLTENDVWMLNYYRSSEIKGALFFGRIARVVRGPLQVDVTHHFADEASHAHYWTQCLNDLGHTPDRQTAGYQDEYFEAAGLPVNLMEVLAITLVFEKRVIRSYSQHLRSDPHPRVRQTIEQIMRDERWHVRYVRDALQDLAGRHGEELITSTLARFSEADEQVYAKTLAEYGKRMVFRNTQAGDDPLDRGAASLEGLAQELELNGNRPWGA